MKCAIRYITVAQKEAFMLSSGQDAPSFDVLDHTGRSVKLSDFAGKNVLLWFYPKADTPG